MTVLRLLPASSFVVLSSEHQPADSRQHAHSHAAACMSVDSAVLIRHTGWAGLHPARAARGAGLRLQGRLLCRAPGRTGDGSLLGARRKLVVAALLGLGLLLLYRGSAVGRLLLGLAVAWAVIAAHACARTPNLKVRLASARDEFRATIRGGYQNYGGADYHTL